MTDIIYAHEHITIDLSGVKKDDDCRMQDKDLALKNARELVSAGVKGLVDMTNRGMGRNPVYAQSVADEAGLRVLHSTGYYKEPFLPDECYELTEKELSSIMIREIVSGIDDTGIKASVIGEIGTSKNEVMPMERKIFDAACAAHLETGAPICTHTTLGTAALEQLEIFKSHGVDLSRVVLSHLDLCGDPEYMLRVLDTGVNIGFDTVGKNNYQPDEKRIEWLETLCSRGHEKQIVLSMDITRKSNCTELGGIGYAYLAENFIPALLASGLPEGTVRRLCADNAVRIYSI